MITDHQAQVREFHEALNVPAQDTPGKIDYELCKLRVRLIKEELREFDDACVDTIDIHDPSLVRIADSLADILYVTYGACVTFGIDIHPIFNAVHRANMRKRGGPVREDGKRLKPPGWIGPEAEIAEIIRHQQAKTVQYAGAEYEGAI